MRPGAGALLAAAAAAAAAVVAAAAGGGSCACAAAAAGAGAEVEAGAGAEGERAGGAHWEFMSGVGAGDSFSYRICDALYHAAPAALPLLLRHQASPQPPPPPLPHAAQPAREWHGAAAPPRGAGGGGGGACYSVTLHVEAVVDRAGGAGGGGGGGEVRGTGSGPLYVVRAEAGAPAAAGPAPGAAGLLVVDSDRFSVRHVFAGDRPLAESLQRTVFWRDGWGGRVPLAYGEPAVELIRGVPSSALLVSGSRVSDDGGRIEYVASHGVRIAPAAGAAAAAAAAGGEGPRWAGRAWGEGAGVSTLVVADGVGLPVSARIHRGTPPPLDHYAGRLAFEFELAWFEQGEGRQAGGRGEAWAGQEERPGPPARAGAAGGPSIDNPHYGVHGRGAAAG